MTKLLLIAVLTLSSLAAFAEHDATYCGKLVSGAEYMKSKGYSSEEDAPDAILIIRYGTLVNYDEYANMKGIGIIYAEGEVLEKIKGFIKTAKATTKFCVKSRWGGSIYGNGVLTDNVQRIDYYSRF